MTTEAKPFPSNPFSLSQKRALVLGGGSGIGQATARALASAGAEVVVAGRRPALLNETVAMITSDGGQAHAAECDIVDDSAFASLLQSESPFHILANSAGVAKHQRFGDITPEALDAVFAVNFRAALLCARAVAQTMKAAKIPGSIINISSQMGHVGGANRAVYCASKHAVEGMTKAAAIDLAADGIRINTVCPTFVRTPMTEKFFEDADFLREVLNSIPLGRMATPEEVASAVVFLASDASAMTTGSAVMVDGGWTAR